MTCDDCRRDFPPELLNTLTLATAVLSGDGPAEVVRTATVCPVCALAVINREHGLPAGTPFRGPKARALYEQAVEHLKATGREAKS